MSAGERRPDLRLGIFGFVVVTLIVLSALLMFARYPAIFHTGRPYRAVFRSVAGLNAGDEVRYGGLLVGSVTSMELDPKNPSRILVDFRVRRNTPIRVDTRASITQLGLLGEPFLQLEPGRSDAAPLAPGSTLVSYDNPTFQDAMARLASFFDRADTVLIGAQRIANMSPLERFDRTLSHVDTFVTVATAGSGRAFSQLDTTSQRLTMLVERADRLVAVLDSTVRTTGPGLTTTQTEALGAVREMRGLVGDLRDALQQQGGMDQLVRNLSEASENLARITDRLDRDPTSLLKRRAKPAKLAGPAVRE